MIELRSASLRALVAPYGATLAGLWAEEYSHSLVIGSERETDYRTCLGYHGALVGPIANRVAGARVTIGHEAWTLPANEGTNSLHGGPEGLHGIDWQTRVATRTKAVFHCVLPHGHGGLPGTRRIEAAYDLSRPDSLRLTLTARSDRDTAMNIAHHPYWNLDGRQSVSEHRLEVPAETWLPVGPDKLPTGEIAAVAGTGFEFRQPAPVPLKPALDINFCLARERLAEPRRCAVLTAPGGPRLEILSTEPGLQVYGGAGLGPVPARLHDERVLGPYAGLALEPQGWPDAPNHAHFPSILLAAGATYRQVTEYRISG